MKDYFEVLKKCPLFVGISEDDMEPLLNCLNVKEINARKGEVIIHAGDRPDYIGIVLKGSVHVVQKDYWGKRTILTDVQTGGLFGEAFSCAEASVLPVSVLAQEAVRFLLVECRKISMTCSVACLFHIRLIQNMMKALATKNIILTRKMEHITKKTTRDKVLSYLSECAIEKGSNNFPFHLTVRNWQIILQLNVVCCPIHFVRCEIMGRYSLKK